MGGDRESEREDQAPIDSWSWSWSPVLVLALVLVGGAGEVLERSQPAFLRSNCRMRQYPTSLLPCLRASCLRAQKFGLHAQRNSRRTGHEPRSTPPPPQ